MSSPKKEWFFYQSRKNVQPQNSNWPAIYHNKRFLCFAHLRPTGKCKWCTFHVCECHSKEQKKCAHCGILERGINNPCKIHHAMISDCKDCDNRQSFTSLKFWKLCSVHAKFKKASRKSKLLQYKQVQQRIVQCKSCFNKIESKRLRQQRYDTIVNLQQGANCRPCKSVQQDASQVKRNNNLKDNVTKSKKSSNNVN